MADAKAPAGAEPLESDGLGLDMGLQDMLDLIETGNTDSPREMLMNSPSLAARSFDGLPSADDPALVALLKKVKPFQCHLYNPLDGQYHLVPSSFASGDDACAKRSIDLRYGLQDDGSLAAVVRFGPNALIMQKIPQFEALPDGGPVHGGAVNSVLDELCSEAAKCAGAVHAGTTDVTTKIKEEFHIGVTYEATASLVAVEGLRYKVKAEVVEVGTKKPYAEASATLVDYIALAKQRGQLQ